MVKMRVIIFQSFEIGDMLPKQSNIYICISTPVGSLMWWGPQFAYYGAKAECGAKAGCENISQV